MVSALQAAAVVNTALRSPGHAQLACRFYRDRLHEFAQSDLDASAAYYNQQAQICPTDFWLQRANRAVSKPAISPHHLHAPSADQRLRLSREARLEIIGALQDDLIVPHHALHHPRLVRPVAYLAGHPIESFLAAAQRELTPAELRAVWGRFVSEAEADFVLSWLFSHEILVSAAPPALADDGGFVAEALGAARH